MHEEKRIAYFISTRMQTSILDPWKYKQKDSESRWPAAIAAVDVYTIVHAAYVFVGYHNLVVHVWPQLMDVKDLPPDLLVDGAIQIEKDKLCPRKKEEKKR